MARQHMLSQYRGQRKVSARRSFTLIMVSSRSQTPLCSTAWPFARHLLRSSLSRPSSVCLPRHAANMLQLRLCQHLTEGLETCMLLSDDAPWKQADVHVSVIPALCDHVAWRLAVVLHARMHSLFNAASSWLCHALALRGTSRSSASGCPGARCMCSTVCSWSWLFAWRQHDCICVVPALQKLRSPVIAFGRRSLHPLTAYGTRLPVIAFGHRSLPPASLHIYPCT